MVKLQIKISRIVSVFKTISGLSNFLINDYSSLANALCHITGEKNLHILFDSIVPDFDKDECILEIRPVEITDKDFLKTLKRFEDLVK